MDNQSMVLRRLCTPDRVVSRPGVHVRTLAHASETMMRGSQSTPVLPRLGEATLAANGWETSRHITSPQHPFRRAFAKQGAQGRLRDQFQNGTSHPGFTLTTAVDRKGPFTSANMQFRVPDRQFVDAQPKSKVRVASRIT